MEITLIIVVLLVCSIWCIYKVRKWWRGVEDRREIKRRRKSSDRELYLSGWSKEAIERYNKNVEKYTT